MKGLEEWMKAHPNEAFVVVFVLLFSWATLAGLLLAHLVRWI